MRILYCMVLLLACPGRLLAQVEFHDGARGVLKIEIDGEAGAEYVYEDPEIPRPHFRSLHAPGGLQVTRTQPPDPQHDVADHPLFHPGIWLSFGDLNGSDYWRLAAKVRFVEFTQQPQRIDGGGEFAARFEYLDQRDPTQLVCTEQFYCRVLQQPAGTLITWDSTFSSPAEFAFGDQEEMGLGVRMATLLRAERQPRGTIPAGTGTILDAEGRKNGQEVWGQTARWCDYSGSVEGQRAGVTLFCHPENFRPSWFHARDYGLLVANPFGRKAFKQGELSRVVIQPGDALRLRYGILLHGGQDPDLVAAYQNYISLTHRPQTEAAHP